MLQRLIKNPASCDQLATGNPVVCKEPLWVNSLDELLEEVKQAGVTIDPHRKDYDYGRFAWITDPDGNRIELWELPKA